MHATQWQQVTNTQGVNPDGFLEYQNLSEGLVIRLALNLFPTVLQSQLPENLKGRKIFYLCIACRTENESKMGSIFKKYHHEQTFTAISIRYEGEIGFIAWLPYHAQTPGDLNQIFETLCDAEKLEGEAVPRTIKEKFQEKMAEYLKEKETERVKK